MVKQEHGVALAVRVGDRLVLYNLAWVAQGAGPLIVWTPKQATTPGTLAMVCRSLE